MNASPAPADSLPGIYAMSATAIEIEFVLIAAAVVAALLLRSLATRVRLALSLRRLHERR